MNKDKKITRWLYWFSLAVATILVYKILDDFADITNWVNGILKVIMPFIAGILIAYLFYIPCRKVESALKKSKSKMIVKGARKFSIFLVYFIVVLIIIILINFILPSLSESITELAKNLPNYYNNALKAIANQPEDSIWNKLNVKQIIESLQSIDITKIFSLDNIWGYIKGAMGILSGVFSVFVTIVVSIYVLAERTEILEFLRKLAYAIFKGKTAKHLGAYFAKANEVFFKFISSQVLDGIIVGIITSIAMLVMGVKYAILLGFMIGLLNIIPYFGAIVGVIIATVITIFTGGIGQAIWLVIIVTILQQIDSNIINPKIIGNSLKISPLLIIFAVTIGGAYFGFLGMFLAVPIIAVLKIIVMESINYKNSL